MNIIYLILYWFYSSDPFTALYYEKHLLQLGIVSVMLLKITVHK